MANMSDTFDRADSATGLGTSSSGHAWTGVNGGERLGIQTNRAYPFTGNGYHVLPAAAADGWARITVSAGSSSARLGIICRHDGGANVNNVVSLLLRDSGNVVLSKRVAGAGTTIQSVAHTVGNGDLVTFSWQGSAYKAWVNGTLVIDASDTSLNTNTRHGIVMIETDGRLDDYSFREEPVDIAPGGTVAATGVAYNASVAVGPSAGTAAATGSAEGVTASIGSAAGTATALGEASPPRIDIVAQAQERVRMGGWMKPLGIIQEARDLDAEEANKVPVDCPNDGTVLLEGPGGVLFCPFDGWQPGH